MAGSVNELTERDSRSVDVAIEAEGLMSEIPVQEVLPMKPETAAKVKYGIWGLICGAIIAMIIGFAWGGWTTSGTSVIRRTVQGSAGMGSGRGLRGGVSRRRGPV